MPTKLLKSGATAFSAPQDKLVWQLPILWHCLLCLPSGDLNQRFYLGVQAGCNDKELYSSPNVKPFYFEKSVEEFKSKGTVKANRYFCIR
jgi:hypothetical protein